MAILFPVTDISSSVQVSFKLIDMYPSSMVQVRGTTQEPKKKERKKKVTSDRSPLTDAWSLGHQTS
jgi:hypothetical protein